MAAQRSRARCGMIRRRADVVASKTGNCRSDTRVSTRATGGHTRNAALSGNFCNGILLFKSNSKHVRAVPWPSGRWRRIDTGYSGRLHGLEHARGHAQPHCRGGGGVGRGKGCRRRRRSGGGPPAWCNAYGRGRHTAAQRTCARPTRRTGGRMGSTTA